MSTFLIIAGFLLTAFSRFMLWGLTIPNVMKMHRHLEDDPRVMVVLGWIFQFTFYAGLMFVVVGCLLILNK